MHSGKHDLVQMTLEYMKEIVTDSSRTKKISELPSIQLLLKNHSSIINLSKDATQLKQQSIFYEIIATLVICQDIQAQFFPFLSQFDGPIQSLLSSKLDPLQVTPRWKLDVQSMFYILIGIARALHTPASFSYFFEWIYPEHFRLMQQTLRLYPANLEIHNALQKFLKELTSNATQRLMLDNINGFVIFKGCCPIIADLLQVQESYAGTMPDVTAMAQFPEKTATCYKMLRNIIDILVNIMVGNYVQFGLLELYNDNCFVLLSQLTFRRIFATNMGELPKYTNAEQSVYCFLQDFLKCHTEMAFNNYDSSMIAAIIKLTKLGLTSESSEVVTMCSDGLDEFLLFIVKERLKSKQRPRLQTAITRFLNDCSGLLLETTETILHMVCYEEGKCVHTLVDPLFSLILLDRELFDRAKEPVLAGERSATVRARIFEELQKLFADVKFNLDSGERSKFVKNFYKFKATSAGFCK